MPELKASTIQYKFSVDEIKNMLARELGALTNEISVTYDKTDMSDDRFDRYPRYEVTSVTVTVDNTKTKK
jgi:hypothetical protein